MCYADNPVYDLGLSICVVEKGMQNSHNKKVSFAYTILFPERLHFCRYYEIFLISVTGLKKKSGYYLKYQKESHWIQSLWDAFR